jgi:hypothetical protein
MVCAVAHRPHKHTAQMRPETPRRENMRLLPYKRGLIDLLGDLQLKHHPCAVATAVTGSAIEISAVGQQADAG